MKTMLIKNDIEHRLKLMMLIVLFSVAPSSTLYYLITLMNQIIEICIKSALTLMKEYVYHVSFGVMYLTTYRMLIYFRVKHNYNLLVKNNRKEEHL